MSFVVFLYVDGVLNTRWEKGEKKYTIEFLKNEDGYCLGQMKKKYNEEADYEDYEYVKGLIA